MTKFFFIIFLLNLIFLEKAHSLDTTAKQAIVYDYQTKSIIFEKNSKELVSPSSMSKIMTLYYLFKKIKEGEVLLTDQFKVSKKAWKKGGSRMFVNLNSLVSVEDLIRGIIVQSGNDACIVVAEAISGSEEAFADELNILAEEIGLKNSNFKNSTGWPDPEHLMTVEDLLTLTIKTIEDFPEFYHYYSEKEFTYNKIKQINRNPMLFSNLIADGLKTGHTSLGGYGLVASVVKDDRRVIVILNGLKSSKRRASESEKLAKVALNQYSNIIIANKNEVLKSLNVWNGKKKLLDVVSQEDLIITIPKKIKNQISIFIKYKRPLLAPIKKGQIVAELTVKKKNTEIKIAQFNLHAKDNINKISFFPKIYYNFKYLILGDSIFSE